MYFTTDFLYSYEFAVLPLSDKINKFKLKDKIVEQFNKTQLDKSYLKSKGWEGTSKTEADPYPLILKQFENNDPSAQKDFAIWYAQKYAKGNIKLEDLGRGKAALELYSKLKNKKKLASSESDLNKINSIHDLEDVVGKYKEEDLSTKKEKKESEDRGNFKELHRDNEFILVEILDETAAKFWGRNTKWCTSGDKDNQANNYLNEGKLYTILIKDGNRKFQYWEPESFNRSAQFMDEQDKNISLHKDDKYYPIFEKAVRISDSIKTSIEYKLFNEEEVKELTLGDRIKTRHHTVEDLEGLPPAKQIQSHLATKLMLLKAMMSRSSAVKEAVINHPNVDKQILMFGIKDDFDDVREEVAKSLKADTEILKLAVLDGNSWVAIRAVENPNADKTVLMLGAEHPTNMVMDAVAANPKSDLEVLRKLLSNQELSDSTLETIVSNKHADENILLRGMKSEKSWVRSAAAENPNATKNILEQAVQDKRYEVGQSAVRNKNADKDIFMLAMKMSNLVKEVMFSENMNVDKEVLLLGAKEPVLDIRQAVQRHSNADSEVRRAVRNYHKKENSND